MESESITSSSMFERNRHHEHATPVNILRLDRKPSFLEVLRYNLRTLGAPTVLTIARRRVSGSGCARAGSPRPLSVWRSGWAHRQGPVESRCTSIASTRLPLHIVAYCYLPLILLHAIAHRHARSNVVTCRGMPLHTVEHTPVEFIEVYCLTLLWQHSSCCDLWRTLIRLHASEHKVSCLKKHKPVFAWEHKASCS